MLKDRFFLKKIALIGVGGFVLGFGFLAGLDWWGDFGSGSPKVEGAEVVNSDLFQEEGGIPVKVMIAPHHLMAEDLIRDVFGRVSELNQVASSQVKRVILVSSSHSEKGNDWVITADQTWDERFSELKIDQAVSKSLQSQDLAQVENPDFRGEHGIENLLPFIQKSFPQAQVLPLMIKSGYSSSQVKKLAQGLEELDQDGQTLLILSADFSHYLDQNWARFHDQKSLEVISNFDLEQVYSLDVDCPEGLYLTLQMAQSQGAEQFNFLQNANSGELADQALPGEVTSYITGFFTSRKFAAKELTQSGGSQKAPQVEAESAHLLFGGDVMLDRNIRSLINEKGVDHLTKPVERIFWSQDLNWVNLEGAITTNLSVSLGASMDNFNHFRFTFDPEQSRKFLAYNRIGAVSLANNHALNFGSAGLQETYAFLDDQEVSYLGYFSGPQAGEVAEASVSSSSESSETATPSQFQTQTQTPYQGSLVREINGQKIASTSYNWFGGADLEQVKMEVTRLTKIADYVIVYAHWGAEYKLTATGRQQNEAHQLVEAGADLIIGAHPHVVEPVEIYQSESGEQRGVIFYSLGNLIFDQYFSPEVQERLVVGLRLNQESVEFNLAPLNVNDERQLIFAPSQQREKLLERLARDSEVSAEVKSQIREGRFEVRR